MPRKSGMKKMRKARGLPYGGKAYGGKAYGGKAYGGKAYGGKAYGGSMPYGGSQQRQGGWIGALLGTLGSALLPSVLPHLMEGN